MTKSLLHQLERDWYAVVTAPQGGPVFKHYFEGKNPGDVLREIAGALDLSAADGVDVSLTLVRRGDGS